MATMAVFAVVWLASHVFVTYRFLRDAEDDAAFIVNHEKYVSEKPTGPRFRFKREARCAA